MKVNNKNMLLYAVTDRAWLRQKTLAQQVGEAIEGGTTFIQIREKNIPDEKFFTLAKSIKSITDRYNIPFVINDNIQIALKVNADGVHIGQNDCSVPVARRLIGEEKILGVSVQTVPQALSAEKEGADYLGVGAIFATSTKADANTVSFDELKAICQSVSIPVVAIGGIDTNNISDLRGSGVSGVAVVSALFASSDIRSSAKQLLTLSKTVCSSNF